MAITTTVAPIESALWPQGDIRDPLGIWGARVGVTGDASGGPIQATVRVDPGLRSAYVYTCYSVSQVKLTGTASAANCKVRLLTNWPNVDPQAGVQAYSEAIGFIWLGSGAWTGQISVPPRAILRPQHRFILLFDPRPSPTTGLNIVEFQTAENEDTATYVFEAYGYFWDRSVLNAPGGPRHPGAS